MFEYRISELGKCFKDLPNNDAKELCLSEGIGGITEGLDAATG